DCPGSVRNTVWIAIGGLVSAVLGFHLGSVVLIGQASQGGAGEETPAQRIRRAAANMRGGMSASEATYLAREIADTSQSAYLARLGVDSAPMQRLRGILVASHLDWQGKKRGGIQELRFLSM